MSVMALAALNFQKNTMFPSSSQGMRRKFKSLMIAADIERCFFKGGSCGPGFAAKGDHGREGVPCVVGEERVPVKGRRGYFLCAKSRLADFSIRIFVFVEHLLLDVTPSASFPRDPSVADRPSSIH